MTDAFDDTLDHVADVLTKQTGTADDYGVSTHSFSTVDSNVKVRVSLGRGRAREDKAEKKTALNYREVFLRPWYSDKAPDGSFVRNHVVNGTTYNTKPLDHTNWLRIDGRLYDVYQVDNPGEQDHHIEAWCTLILE